VIGPEEIRRLHPLVDTRGVLGAVWNPEDGHVDPTSVTQALVEGRPRPGRRASTATRASPGSSGPRAGSGASPRTGATSSPRIVVNAAGTWAREIGQLIGPRSPDRAHGAPVPRHGGHPRGRGARPGAAAPPRGRRLVLPPAGGPGTALGPYERRAKPFGVGGIPPTLRRRPPAAGPGAAPEIVEAAMARVPVLARAGIQRIVNGPITYTPDGNPLLGPAFGLPRLLARLRAELRDHPGRRRRALPGGVDRGGSAVHRSLGGGSAPLRSLRDGAVRGLALHRHLRGRVRDRVSAGRPPAGRPARTSPLYDRFRAQARSSGCATAGSGRTGFAPPGTEPCERPSFRRTNWFDAVGREARAVRERAGSSSCRASRSTRSGGRARRPCSTASARTGCRGWPDRPLPAPHRPRAPSSATSRSRGSSPSASSS
jgi:dimethylglycine dehydrogenase